MDDYSIVNISKPICAAVRDNADVIGMIAGYEYPPAPDSTQFMADTPRADILLEEVSAELPSLLGRPLLRLPTIEYLPWSNEYLWDRGHITVERHSRASTKVGIAHELGHHLQKEAGIDRNLIPREALEGHARSMEMAYAWDMYSQTGESNYLQNNLRASLELKAIETWLGGRAPISAFCNPLWFCYAMGTAWISLLRLTEGADIPLRILSGDYRMPSNGDGFEEIRLPCHSFHP